MPITDLADDPEDPQHSPAERAAAAWRSTWVSVGVNLAGYPILDPIAALIHAATAQRAP